MMYMRGQATLEAIISMAAIAAFLAVLAAAASEYAAHSAAFSGSVSESIRTEMLALSLNIHAADARLTTFSNVSLDGCALEYNGVRCKSSYVETMTNNSGRGRYEFFESLPV